MIIQKLIERRANSSWMTDFLTGMDDYFSTFTGENVTQSSALTLSAWYNGVNSLGDDVGKLPAHVFKRSSGRKVEIDYNHPAVPLISLQPNALMNAITYKKLLETRRLNWGHGLSYVDTDFNGYPSRLLPLPPEYTVHYVDENGELWYVLSIPGLPLRKLPSSDVIDVKGYSTDGVTANSVLGYARESLGVGLAEQKFEGNLYKSGMKLGGVLETPTKLDTDGKDKVRREFEKMTSGLSNMHRVAVLDLGQKFTKLDMPLKDVQFVESKKANIADISRFLKFPLYKQQEGDQSYNANEQQAIDYVTNTLDPILVQYEQEYTLKLFTPKERKKYYVRINRAAQLRANLTARKEFLQAMVQNGIYTIDEARAFEELNYYDPGSDNPTERLLVSRNYVFIEDLSKTISTGDPVSQRGE